MSWIKWKAGAWQISLVFALVFFWNMQAKAVFVEERLDDPRLEERARNLAEGIRCLVCQNQSIMDSNADLAKDLRSIVRERISAGDSDEEVRQFLVSRYGDWVLLNPPFRLRTIMLWVFPFVALVLGGVFVVRFLRSRQNPTAENANLAPLSPEEEAELEKMLGSGKDGGRK
ncbi:cytochrome c-type biogenesis protein [Sneathiella glossodoripedis]|uniref:cytochrome c-type biogenesis protein n=1 Tax=Sneathiella glossodoripedis TaxID=418853 RepID=UPI000472F87F|nr:cytochrome c-type biogenesis protein [Sneathiella glossodoripedis]